MKPDERNIDDVLKQTLPSAPRGQMEAGLDRVHARLRSDTEPRVFARRDAQQTTPAREPGSPKRVREGGIPLVRMAAAAAVVVAAIWGATSFRDPGVYAVLEAADGAMYRTRDGKPLFVGDRIRAQETVRADGLAGAVLALSDGSRVEMGSMSTLSWEHAADGLKLRLDAGSVIVIPPKQPTSPLYVQTKDMTASIAGTIALVNAAEDGYRVAVIQGEARVQEGSVEKRVRPGEQVSTSPTLAARSVKEEIAGSRNGNVLLSILDTFNNGMEQTKGPLAPLGASTLTLHTQDRAGAGAVPREFEEASIRPCDPDNVPAAPAGARGGGANSFQMTPGRLHALCMTLATIVRHAYGYGPVDLDFLNPGGRGRGLQFTNIYGLGVEDGKRVRGGPDWVRTEHYTIEAVGPDSADAAAMSGPMLRALLESRFKLKAHIDTEQIPSWTLVIANGGLKIKSVATDTAACEPQPTVGRGQPAIVRPAQPGERQPPPPSTPGEVVTVLFRNFVDVRRGEKPTCGMSTQPNGPNQVIVAGGVTLEALARNLAGPLGGVTITDKTGNTDKFNIVLEFVRDENTPGPKFLSPPNQPEQPLNAGRAPTIFVALEEQLGLKLEPAKAPRDFIVIDRVERPSAN